MSPPALTARDASAWARALLAGATTEWSVWIAASSSRARTDQATGHLTLPYLPGAQHLELLRRLNVAAAAAGTRLSPAQATRVVHAGLPDRTRPDLDLCGLPAREFGPPRVDPTELGPDDLLPVAAGLIAEDLAGLDDAPVTADASRAGRLLLPRARQAGDPWALLHPGRRSARGRRTYVQASDLGTLAVHAWAARAVAGGDQDLVSWLRDRIDGHRLPAALDLVTVAARCAEHVGVRRTVIVLDPAMLPAGTAPTPPPVRSASIELARRVGRPLGVLVPARRRRHLLVSQLLPALEGLVVGRPSAPYGTAPPATVPEPWASHLRDHADRMIPHLATAGYPVLGSLDRLRPADRPAGGHPPRPATQEGPDPMLDEAPDRAGDDALALAIHLLLETATDGAQ